MGDLQLLRELGEIELDSACVDAPLSAPAMQKPGLDELAGQTRTVWLAAAEKALDEHRISIAPLPISELLKLDVYLADLASRGYVVTAPDNGELSMRSRWNSRRHLRAASALQLAGNLETHRIFLRLIGFLALRSRALNMQVTAKISFRDCPLCGAA